MSREGGKPGGHRGTSSYSYVSLDKLLNLSEPLCPNLENAGPLYVDYRGLLYLMRELACGTQPSAWHLSYYYCHGETKHYGIIGDQQIGEVEGVLPDSV